MAKKKHTTIQEVAKFAGVSPITASRALSNPKLVKDVTRRRVEAAAKELNFIPNFAAGILSKDKSNMVGLIVPTLSNSIFADTLQALSETISSHGIQLLIGTNNYSIDREEDIIKTFISHRADGLILTGHTHTAYAEELIKSFAIPTLEIWNLRKRRDFVCVGMSNYRAAYEMTEYLIKKEYKRIGYIGGLLANNDRSEDRLNGYRDALKNYGVEFDSSIIRESDFSLLNGAEAMRSLLTLTHRPDCVFASSDIIAFGALIECQNKGISIPSDIALAGFDDAVIGSMTKPGLTTVRVPRRQIGLKAGNVIMKLLQKDPDISSVNDLGFDLAIRDTA